MKFSLDKKSKSVIAVYGIILIAYVLLFLVIPFHKIAASWITFAFTIISIVFSLYATAVAFSKSKKLVAEIYGFPIFRVGAIYAAAQFVLGVILCAIAAFVNVPYWVALLISVLLLGAGAIGVIATDNIRDTIEKIDEKNEKDTKTFTVFKIDLESIVDMCEDAALKAELKKLSEQFRYSDPVSNDNTVAIEDELIFEIDALKDLVASNDVETSLNKVRIVSNKLKERNRICKAYKK